MFTGYSADDMRKKQIACRIDVLVSSIDKNILQDIFNSIDKVVTNRDYVRSQEQSITKLFALNHSTEEQLLALIEYMNLLGYIVNVTSSDINRQLSSSSIIMPIRFSWRE